MSDVKDPSLEDTLKGILEESKVDEGATEAPIKPKRTRRTKAQIEADALAEKQAKEAADADKEKPSEAEAPKKEEVPQEDKTDDSTTESVELTAAESDVSTPEVIEDTEADKEADVEDTEPAPQEGPEETLTESMDPEVVEDTEADKLPDVEEPKEAVTPKRHPSGEAIEAFQEEEKKDPNSIIGRSLIFDNATPIYRARHLSMKLKPYKGFVTIIEDPKYGFVKIQFLRQGFGLCEGYVESYHVLSRLEVNKREEERDTSIQT